MWIPELVAAGASPPAGDVIPLSPVGIDTNSVVAEDVAHLAEHLTNVPLVVRAGRVEEIVVLDIEPDHVAAEDALSLEVVDSVTNLGTWILGGGWEDVEVDVLDAGVLGVVVVRWSIRGDGATDLGLEDGEVIAVGLQAAEGRLRDGALVVREIKTIGLQCDRQRKHGVKSKERGGTVLYINYAIPRHFAIDHIHFYKFIRFVPLIELFYNHMHMN